MKKILLVLVLSLTIVLTGCNKRQVLQVLNWGEYINEDMVKQFEDEFGVDVKIDTADSNEAMYERVASQTTVYDIVVPSDYMIQKMHAEDLLHAIDTTKLSNYAPEKFMTGAYSILEELFDGAKNYAVPYFWGTWGIIYNTKKVGLENAVMTHGLKTLFEPNLVPEGTRVGMYDVPRYSYATALLYKGLDPNLDTTSALNTAESTLSLREFAEWGTDTLKHNIGSNNLDLAYTWTGDFFDVLYAKQASGISLDDMPFGLYVPQVTIGFMDAMVIPANARKVDLAHQFINFFLDPEVSYNNASIIGYTTPLLSTYNRILSDPDTDWAKAISKYSYMPAAETVANPLNYFSDQFISEVTLMVNNVKTK